MKRSHLTFLIVGIFLSIVISLILIIRAYDININPFDDVVPVVYPDTSVVINSLIPQVCEVTVRNTDSTYHVTSYWTDKYTGRIIYKMEDSPYKHSRLHGVQYRYDEDGDTLLIAHFENGIRVDSTVYYYPNGNPKHKYFYSFAKDGNIAFEIQFHENGQRKTDMIAYDNGLLNGAVSYYSDGPKNELMETFFYREGELIGIKIHNRLYEALDRKRDALLKEYRADSIRLAEVLKDFNNTKDVPVFYAGSGKDAMYDLGNPDTWDIMKVDPVFMLKYYNR